MRERFPMMNILAITEGIDTSRYSKGKTLNERSIDLLEFGRRNAKVFNVSLPDTYNHIFSKRGEHIFRTEDDLIKGLADSKITVCFPRCDTQPQKAGNIETLTQRYWEAMLSGVVIVGRAPKELINLIGYNPVVEIEKEHQADKIEEIIEHIDDYQSLVNKNRDFALKMGSWESRIKQIMNWLRNCDYSI